MLKDMGIKSEGPIGILSSRLMLFGRSNRKPYLRGGVVTPTTDISAPT